MTYLEVHALNVETLLENPRWNNIYIYICICISNLLAVTPLIPSQRAHRSQIHSIQAGTPLNPKNDANYMRKRDMLQNAANLAISTTKQYSTKPNSLKDYARNKNIVKKQKK